MSKDVFLEDRLINNQIRQYTEIRTQFKKARGKDGEKIHFLFDDIEKYGVYLEWYESDLKEFAQLWKEGWSLEKMAEWFSRNMDEIGLATMYLAIIGKIQIEDRQKTNGGKRG